MVLRIRTLSIRALIISCISLLRWPWIVGRLHPRRIIKRLQLRIQLVRMQTSLSFAGKRLDGQPEDVRASARIRDLLAALKSCISSRDLQEGIRIHAAAAQCGDDSNIYVANTLINMYAKCRSLEDALKVFDAMSFHDVVAWNVVILGHVENGEAEEALQFFQKMQVFCSPNSRTLVAALKACSSLAGKEDGIVQVDGKVCKIEALEKGMAVHCLAAKIGNASDGFVMNSLVDMYANCGSMVDASRIFHSIKLPTTVSWTALISGYAENGEEALALRLFSCMRAEGVEVDALSFIAAIKACTSFAATEKWKKSTDGSRVKMTALENGMSIHSQTLESRSDQNIFLASSLVDMYGKCGSMVDARKVFDRMSHRNVVSWNSLILGYAENGLEELAVEIFEWMWVRKPCEADGRTFVAALKACTGLAAKEEGREVCCGDGETKTVKMKTLEKGMIFHRLAADNRILDHNVYLASTLIDVYAKCGRIAEAQRVFDRLNCKRNVVIWNALMLGYVEIQEAETVLELFSQMRADYGDRICAPDARTFVAALKACTILAEEENGEIVDGKSVKLRALETGMIIHSAVAKMKFEADMFVASALVGMYAKAGMIAYAQKVFDTSPNPDLPLRTALICGYAENGEVDLGLNSLMQLEIVDLTADASTYVAALNVCAFLVIKAEEPEDKMRAKAVCLDKGMQIHSRAAEAGFDSDVDVARSLVQVYAKCGSLWDARRVFDRIPQPDAMSFNALMFGYVEDGDAKLALELFFSRTHQQMHPDGQTFVAALKACGKLVCLEGSKGVHACVCGSGSEDLLIVVNSLIELYGRCGSMIDAQQVFDSLQTRSLVTWTALMEGYSRQGVCERVFDLFHAMRGEDFQPDSVSLICVLTACSHAGLLEQGKKVLRAMKLRYGVTPCIDHFVCMIDLLGRANELASAVEMVECLPVEDRNGDVWRVLLASCQKWKDVVVGRRAFDELLKLEDRSAASYASMAITYTFS